MQRNKLPENTEFFSGNFEDIDKFVPQKLTRRKVSSKVASLYDLKGKFTPIIAGLKVDLREVVRNTEGWDDAMPMELRSKWLQNFWAMEQLRGLKFSKARMPTDAVSDKLRIITLVDASMEVLVIGCWVGFKRPAGKWSC